MKHTVNHIIRITFLSFVLCYTGCQKKLNDDIDILPAQPINGTQALVKVYNAALNTSRNFMFVDNTLVTGITFAYGGLFPSTGYSAALVPGSRSILIKDTLSTTTQNQLSFTSNFEAGKNYTIFMYDSTTTVKQKTISDVLLTPSAGNGGLRFANFIFSKTSVPNVDVFSKRQNKNIFSNIAPTGVTGFIPYQADFNDTFYVRAAGVTATNLATLNGLSLTEKRSYTLVFRGGYQSASGATIRTLGSFNNY